MGDQSTSPALVGLGVECGPGRLLIFVSGAATSLIDRIDRFPGTRGTKAGSPKRFTWHLRGATH